MVTTARRIPRQRRRPLLARPGRLYLILTLPVDAFGNVIPGPPEVGYIGQTRQQVWQRGDQHRACQPFADIIVGDVLLLDQGVWTDEQLSAREEMWIRNGVSVGGRPRQRPRYNHDCNLDNPDRIEIWRAVEHRQRREPGWQPPKDRAWVPRQRVPVRPARTRPGVVGWWERHRWWVAGWVALWLLLTAGMWWVGAGSWSGWRESRNAALLGTCAWTVIAWRAWKGRRPARRRRGRGRR